jgi:hypothetical protein
LTARFIDLNRRYPLIFVPCINTTFISLSEFLIPASNMEAHCGFWRPSIDGTIMTTDRHHQALVQTDATQLQYTSEATEEEWQQILDKVDADQSATSPDFNMLTPTSPDSKSPRRSIDTSATFGAETPNASGFDSSSSLFAYVHQEPTFPTWQTYTNSTPLTFPPAIPGHIPRVPPPPPLTPHGLPNTALCGSPGLHLLNSHVDAGLSPMLDDASPHPSTCMDNDLAQQQIPVGWPTGNDEDIDGLDPADPCYAQLLWRCLKEAPDHTMSLRELYDWVKDHSQKANDPKSRGWQNSVRHNLSMNAVSVLSRWLSIVVR